MESHVDRGTPGNPVLDRCRPTLGTIQAACRVLDLTLSDVIVFINASMKDVAELHTANVAPIRCSR